METTIQRDGETVTLKEGESFQGHESDPTKVDAALEQQFIAETGTLAEQIVNLIKQASLDYTTDSRVAAAGISLAFLNLRHFFPEGQEFFDKCSQWAQQYFDENVNG